MKEPYRKGRADHPGPESCANARKDGREALTGESADRVLSCENTTSGGPTPSSEAEGNTAPGEVRKSDAAPAQPETPRMRGHSSHGNREIPSTPTREGAVGRSEKTDGRTPDMHVGGKSDGDVVPEKQPNKGEELPAPAEAVEGRSPAKGNPAPSAASRTQGRTRASSGLRRVREVAERDKEVRFTALLHHVTPALLEASFYALKRGAAAGVDGCTWEEYEVGLEGRLRDLHDRVHRGTYRAQPSRRTYIPKADGRMRPLGIAALEDKIVQMAVVQVLQEIYEADFLGFSYGFRPKRNAHQALDALWVGLVTRKVSCVLDADIRAFFDTIDHGWMMKFLEHRIADRRVLRLIQKWLKAGVLTDGTWTSTEVGTPQGAVISPLLANVYLHYVLDLWVEQWRDRHATGDVIIVRYADDFVLGFQHRHEAERFLRELGERLKKFGLALHPDKTRLIEFGRFAKGNRGKRGDGKPETFNFLGFTHMCAETERNKKFTVKRQTIGKRLTAKLKDVKAALIRRRHEPIQEVGAWLRTVVQGYFNYHALPGNSASLRAFRDAISRYWLRTLRRRSQKHRMTWDRFRKYVDRWLPLARILHPIPFDSFYALHPR